MPVFQIVTYCPLSLLSRLKISMSTATYRCGLIILTLHILLTIVLHFFALLRCVRCLFYSFFRASILDRIKMINISDGMRKYSVMVFLTKVKSFLREIKTVDVSIYFWRCSKKLSRRKFTALVRAVYCSTTG